MTDYLEALWADHAPSDPDDPTWCRYCRDWGCKIRPLVAALRAVEALCDAEWPGNDDTAALVADIRTAIRNALEAR